MDFLEIKNRKSNKILRASHVVVPIGLIANPLECHTVKALGGLAEKLLTNFKSSYN